MGTPGERAVGEHYGREGLEERISAALRSAGADPLAPSVEELHAVDQLHTRGVRATLELAELAGASPGERVLDVGGGLGGPARILASRFGCRVVVLDVTEEFCRVGALLTARAGLGERVLFRHGSALEIPFPDASFDLAWTQHSTMNIPDKDRLYREIHRVLKPGGRLAMHEILAGPSGPPRRFPLPWAASPALSHLLPPNRMRASLSRAGLRELAWSDVTPQTAEWLKTRSSGRPSGPPPEAFANLLLSIREGRATAVQALLERPEAQLDGNGSR
ncbi:Methyltransferase type 11 [Rubrobacter xylanophilus DSM 9941]|uniref:Methyltransferase type 11 n=1 Tax=Rubrobacter xylanophilus (strain DSM 9941 / JCM 11954 / NBRC 16129 / PRD-1) TaxID=266117 RepID=Q1AZM8_RUBXD|nr:methyltransferase domain-containing protein [Rubrobacter xylanophilus]ABG03150.1 Methyltransferase type 11 [Rubrobacter xylanophilus DSM 9941]